MAQATAISIRQFHAAVNSAVAAAHKKHAKIPLPPKVEHVTFIPYLIWGFPVPEPFVQQLEREGLGVLNGVAGEIAAHVQGAVPETSGSAGAPAVHAPAQGAVVSFGGHIIMGKWLAPQAFQGLTE